MVLQWVPEQTSGEMMAQTNESLLRRGGTGKLALLGECVPRPLKHKL